MGRQLRLVLLLFLSVGVFQVALTSTPRPMNALQDDHQEISKESSEETQKTASSGVNISAPKVQNAPIIQTTSTTKKSAPTQKPLSDEVLNDLIEASKHSVALADDPRFNKMLPKKFKLENSTSTSANKSEENYDDDYYEYDDDYNYDEPTSPEPSKKSKATKLAINSSTAKLENKVEMKPIKEEEKLSSKSNDINNNILEDNVVETKHINNKDEDDSVNDDDDDDDDDDGDDDDDYDSDEDTDDLDDEEEIVFNENVPCPRYCVCARNINSYLVATCSRFDRGIQKFGSDITDLIISDVGPKYPILLGPELFKQMGLKQISSIKISNCTIEYLHPEAFHGLDELYSVNLTNVGLAILSPDTFVKNKKLRMLTISGNDLSIMSSVHYLLKSSSIEELDLSRNNLMELNPNAFSQLSNIVYINLSQNNLQTIPDKVFDAVETIEELDLSYNSLKSLPPNIFNRTALAILHLKSNSITGDLRFGTNDLQQLDLSFNNIKSIHHGMFDKMTGLTNLNLKGNGITKIQPDSFLTLKNLRHIDLSINRLDQVSSMMFFKNSELDVIRLNDNPRLSQLPTDGFISSSGYFTVYLLDISNCAIGALGHKTFSTMPHLATLKLAWNNINNLERDTFASLTRLIDLDLSNNLIAKLDELIFMNNNDLTKLNLAGNPIRKLSVRLFLPMMKLRELDVSDCELNSLLADNQYGVGRKYKFFETLRSFNASSNQIRVVSSADVKNFKNLRTLDIAHNPLKCNEDFQDFISYVSLNTNMVTNKMPSLANLDSDTFAEFQPHAGWADLARQVCKHQKMLKPTDGKLEKRIEEVDEKLTKDEKELLNIMETNKLLHKTDTLKESLNEDDNENDASEDKDDADEEEENESDYDDDSDEDEDEEKEDEALYNDGFVKHNKKVDMTKIHDQGLHVEEVDLYKETKDKFLLNKFSLDGDESSDNNAEEEIIIERGHIYYSGYKFLIPIIAVLSCVIIILMVIVKVITIVLRKRGERYRMALLASSKNSIVYQKLTEDIKPTEKEPKQPKVHRYSPINQV